MQEQVDLLVEHKYVQQPLDVTRLIDTTFVDKAVQQIDKAQHAAAD